MVVITSATACCASLQQLVCATPAFTFRDIELWHVQITLASLHQMFDSAKDIMQWLSLCARAVAKADHAVRWTTPLGLPVVQPYRKKVVLLYTSACSVLVRPQVTSHEQPSMWVQVVAVNACLSFIHFGVCLYAHPCIWPFICSFVSLFACWFIS